MSKVISYSTLARQQQLNFLKHKGREYREREDYLVQLRQLLFQVEGQMRQAEIQQLEVFREMADHFKIPLQLPRPGRSPRTAALFCLQPLPVGLAGVFRRPPHRRGVLSEDCCPADRTGKLPRRITSPVKFLRSGFSPGENLAQPCFGQKKTGREGGGPGQPAKGEMMNLIKEWGTTLIVYTHYNVYAVIVPYFY